MEMETKQELAAEELARINQFAKAELIAADVYVFSVRLCDNEVDRDFERFDEAALEKLGELFVGKSGLFDHQWSAEGQTARIYRTEVIREPAVKTQAGDCGCWLKAWAYMLRTEKNQDLIAEIEGGIKKEVSVGCSVARSACSICGASGGSCEHVKGQYYGGKLCYFQLEDPTDAYEWSFVAVPAQRRAGVVKHFGPEDAHLTALRKEAELGRRYLAGLRREVVRLAMLSDDGLDGAMFAKMTRKLEEEELLELRRTYQARVDKRFPMEPQLKERPAAARDDETVFLV
ncbi:hypothetical protein [Dysosmobacter sp.]|uniref:hypothetical protein n=1 Tax=Dysosmobacter sp. TaxID=2591382 RepID=UPI003FD85094